MKIIDTHCHLAMEDFDDDLDEVIKRAKEDGVSKIFTVGTSPSDWEKNLKIAEKFNLYAVMGYSPHDSRMMDDESLKIFLELIENEKVKAIGETGLDYHYDFSSKEEQRKCFEKMVEIAENKGLPLVIHSRESFVDTLSMLKGLKTEVLLHCYTYGVEETEKFLNEGFYFSFSGIITFKKAFKLRESLKVIPLNRLLIETDAPYLSPEPLRGKRCEPSFLKYTFDYIAKFLNMDEKFLEENLFQNSQRFFNI